jgi:tRNA pseudouridine65 synthase
MPLPILFQDRDMVIVNKRSGLLVHRSLIDRHETEFAMQTVRDQIGAHVYPVHRLDKPTSGALVFALSPEMATKLSEQFMAGLVKKYYMAVVRGIPKEKSQLVDYPLTEELDRKADARAAQNKPAQPAVTYVRTIAGCEIDVAVDRYPTSRYSLVEAQPRTGRKHQIRRHLRHLGHPVIGDVNHGVGKHNRFFAERFKVRRLLLACHALTLNHPRTGEPVQIKAPLAEDFAQVLRALGWGEHLA